MIKDKGLFFSVLLHSVILALIWTDISFSPRTPAELTKVPLIIDLKNVQIADKTNLPPKPKQKTVKQAPVPKPSPVVKKTAPAAPLPKPIQKEVLKNSIPVADTPVKKADPTNTPQTQTKQATVTPQSDLKSLLASVDKIKKPRNAVTSPLPSDADVNQGIEGGTAGDYTKPLTISEQDLIASKLQGCWNLDAGVQGVEDMIVEIKALVNKDGRVRDVQILNMRANNPSFRSVAESAKRAIYICDNLGADSPFQILAEKYADHYGSWKEVYVRFNPLNKEVF